MYSGGFYSFPSQEEFWAYWSRYIFINRYQNAPKSVHEVLLELVRDKDYFVITTNVDHCFQKAGFDKKRLFYTQGDYGLFQCSEPCCQETFDNEKTVRAMVEAQGFTVADGVLTPPTDGTPTMAVPSELLPGCPHCGRPMTMNLRCDDKFAEDEGWHAAAERYENFLRTRDGQKILFLELGVGYNTPVFRSLRTGNKRTKTLRKDYFVLTTNVDHQFQKAGFDKHRLFYTQGDYGLFQCNKPCCQKTYDNEATIRQMVEQQKGMRVPTELVPHCPLCGKPMTMNLRCDDTFVQDEGWYSASERYTDFLRRHKGLKVLFLELGAGMNTPTIIKFSFWRMVNEWKNATYACINLGEAYAPREIQANSICINEDIGNVLKQL